MATLPVAVLAVVLVMVMWFIGPRHRSGSSLQRVWLLMRWVLLLLMLLWLMWLLAMLTLM